MRKSIILLATLVFSNIFCTNVFSYIVQPQTAVSSKPGALYCSGAGVYFWWQLGAAQYLKENCDMSLIKSIPTIGASAGAITSTFLLSEANFETLPHVAIALAKEVGLYDRSSGLAGIWGDILRKWLEITIPQKIDPQALANLYIALTPALSYPKLVSSFDNRSELIEAIMASCHIPLFLDGKPFTEFRGESVIDGSFWYFVTKNRFTGLPLPADVPHKDIYWVDYCDDEVFMGEVSGNFMELVQPNDMFNMIE
jgi:hypothetical protein